MYSGFGYNQFTSTKAVPDIILLSGLETHNYIYQTTSMLLTEETASMIDTIKN